MSVPDAQNRDTAIESARFYVTPDAGDGQPSIVERSDNDWRGACYDAGFDAGVRCVRGLDAATLTARIEALLEPEGTFNPETGMIEGGRAWTVHPLEGSGWNPAIRTVLAVIRGAAEDAE